MTDEEIRAEIRRTEKLARATIEAYLRQLPRQFQLLEDNITNGEPDPCVIETFRRISELEDVNRRAKDVVQNCKDLLAALDEKAKEKQ